LDDNLYTNYVNNIDKNMVDNWYETKNINHF